LIEEYRWSCKKAVYEKKGKGKNTIITFIMEFDTKIILIKYQ
jgi:hypothetical protein